MKFKDLMDLQDLIDQSRWEQCEHIGSFGAYWYDGFFLELHAPDEEVSRIIELRYCPECGIKLKKHPKKKRKKK